MNKGLIHFYLGNGKGKSTALFGLAIRALGRNFKVLLVQVLKSRETGEIIYLKKLNDTNLDIIRINTVPKFSWEMSNEEIIKTKNEIKIELEKIKTIFNNYDLVLFDELLNAQSLNYVTEDDILQLINSKKESLELVFTGRSATHNLKEYADYISIINPEKHPYNKGIPARIGIEY